MSEFWRTVILYGLGWTVAAVVVGMIIGGVITNRDRQEGPDMQGLSTEKETQTGPVPGAKVLHVQPRKETEPE